MRKCPFDGCTRHIPSDKFGCRRHWFQLNHFEQAEIWAAFRAYRRGDITLGELQRRQEKVLESWRARQPQKASS